MARTRFLTAVVTIGAVFTLAQAAMAAEEPPCLFLEHLLNFTWNGGGGTDDWQTSTNWTAPTLPVPPPAYPVPFPTYPNDPGRVEDPSLTGENGAVRTLTPLIGADISGNLGSDLTVDINTTSPTVASLKMGGTGTAVTTTVTGTTGRLIFENGELNDTATNPGDPLADPPVEPEPNWSFNQGRALIWSTGTAGEGKENRIDADIQPNDDLDVEGDRPLHIYGDIYEGVRDLNTEVTYDAVPHQTSITNLMEGPGAWLYLHGDIHLDLYDENGTAEGTVDRPFIINQARGVLPPPDPNPTPPDEVPVEFGRNNVVYIDGHFVFPNGSSGEARVELGSVETQESDDTSAIGTIILAANNNATFDGNVTMNRGNVVLAQDGVFGTGSVQQGNPTQYFGFNLIAGNGDRTIANAFDVAQWQTVKGASGVAGIESYGDHSLEISGRVRQTNTRGWVNLLPAGKTLTLSGPQYPLEGDGNNDQHRIYTIDGSGKTIITGGIHTRDPHGVINPGTGHLRVRGTGTVVINFDETHTSDTASDYAGYTWVEGSNLHFHNTQGGESVDLSGNTTFLSSAGAVGVDSGVVGNNTFLGKFNNSTAPTNSRDGGFALWDVGKSIFNIYDDGGLMLGPTEYGPGTALNFNAGSLASAANMSLAAQETGSTFEGSITPSTTARINPNTYMLGGGSGTLRLPNAQLTGTNKLMVTNGGEVRLEGANTYSGTTTVRGKYVTSAEPIAATDRANISGGDDDSDEAFVGNNVYRRSTLTVTSLANGGVASSIGTSNSDATNLVIQGSTLKYVGGAVNTNRLFTVGTAGATIDASGTGTLTFGSTAPLGIGKAANRYGYINPEGVAGNENNEIFGVPGDFSGLLNFQTDDLVTGMAVRDVLASGAERPDQVLVDDDSPIVITSVSGSHVVHLGETDLDADEEDDTDPPQPWNGVAPQGTNWSRNMDFGPAPARFLTLTGSNTGDNTLAPRVDDAPDRDEIWTIGTGAFQTSMAMGGPGENGSVGIRKSGAGTWILTGNNTYTGETQVNAGKLVINGNQSAATGLTTVAAGATLGGSGTLGGDLVANGTVAPGTSAGTLTVGGTYQQNDTATLAIEIGGTSAGAFDLLAVLGTPDGPDPENPAPGDYNANGFVDAPDYAVWRDHFGDTGTPGEVIGDGTGDDMHGTPDGDVDDYDWQFWKAHFGESGPDGEADSSASADLDGLLAIDLINGFTPSIGNTFTVLTAGSIINRGLTLSGEYAGFSLTVNPTSIVLTYIGGGSGSGALAAAGAVPEPSALCLAALALAAVACGRRRR